MSESMLVYIFRHGDRNQQSLMDFSVEDTRGPPGSLHAVDAEPDLSAMGRNQADYLRTWVERGTLPKPSRLWVSPKRRAQNTFLPLSQAQQIPLEIIKELDERSSRENMKDFRERVIRCLQKAAHTALQKEVLFLCSHYDWLEDAITWIPSSEDLAMDGNPLWAPGAYVGFEIQNDEWILKQKGQLQTW